MTLPCVTMPFWYGHLWMTFQTENVCIQHCICLMWIEIIVSSIFFVVSEKKSFEILHIAVATKFPGCFGDTKP